jgi:cytochrome c oxidase cbb3-type subunit 4
MNLSSLGEYLAPLWTLWSIAICLALAYWALRPANRERFRQDANIPLNDER